MSGMKKILDEDQRLVLLLGLVDFGGDANESVLQSCLDHFGHRISRDQVRTIISWLKEQGLVEVKNVCDCMVVTITGRGQDVAEGRIETDGVKKPRRKG